MCTPGFPLPWIFYPTWLAVPGILPRALIMDWADYERATEAAHSDAATPFDALAWETLSTYRDYGFLRIEEASEAGEWRRTPLEYREIVAPPRLRALERRADDIVADLGPERVRRQRAAGGRAWRDFLREMQGSLGNRAPLLESATLRAGGLAPARGPMDPERFVRRSLMGLSVAFDVRDACRGRPELGDARVVVFTTPEHRPAARLLVERRGLDPDAVVFPDASLRSNEHCLRRALRLGETDGPLGVARLELLQQAVDEIGRRVSAGAARAAVRARMEADAEAAVGRVRRSRASPPPVDRPGALPDWFEVAAALLDGGSAGKERRLVRLFSLVTGLARGRAITRRTIPDAPAAARFLVSRELLYGFRPRFPLRTTWVRMMIGLARGEPTRPATSRRIQRRLLHPWNGAPVWYDPARAPAG